MLRKLFHDECGAVISAELVLVLTILVIGVIVGLSEVAVAVNTELNDVSNAIGALDQSYFFTGFRGQGFLDKLKNATAGSRYNDVSDDCDANATCDLVCGAPFTGSAG
jgi:Flp pilus assembly pilin Flp